MNPPSPPPKPKARYIMVGGFLGAGKTTAIARLARHLTGQGWRVGLITNDQGSELVDTALLRARGFATEEISGGCFCCRFNSLVDAARNLTAAARPDVFIAEPVGSCTDLVATVSYPLRRMYGEDYALAPLSVLVDPVRARRVFGLEDGGKFSDKVLYIYRKQLEEADLIVINKCDLVEADRRAALRERLRAEFPQAGIVEISARTGDGLESWFDHVATGKQSSRAAMEVDYELYADGEALLGWLNATIRIDGARPFDANQLLEGFARAVQSILRGQAAEVAHLKMTFGPEPGLGDLAVVNLVRNDFVPELSQSLEEPVQAGQLIVNLRAEAPPEDLRAALQAALCDLAGDTPGLTAHLEHLEHFRPGKPRPTHRFAAET